MFSVSRGIFQSLCSACLQSVGLFDSLLPLLVFRVEEDANQTAYACNNCCQTLSAAPFVDKVKATNDGNQSQNEGEIRTKSLIGDIAVDDPCFQTFTVGTLPFSHGHDALDTIGNHIVVLSDEARKRKRPRKGRRMNLNKIPLLRRVRIGQRMPPIFRS